MRDGFVAHTAEGALGGVLGTLLIKQTLALGRRMPESLKPEVPIRDPADVVLSRLEGVRGRAFSTEAHGRFVTALHWAYGIGWGGLLGLAVGGLHARSTQQILGFGAGMGALVWAVDNVALLPRAGLARPVYRQSAGQIITSLLTHVACGVAASVPILIIDRVRERREPWWRRLARRVR
jgi:hypothetical protein